MKRYRKKPLIVEAIQWEGNTPALRSGTIGWPHEFLTINLDGDLLVHTLEGCMKANIGDYVVRGIEGELYPCKKHIFEKLYEEVESE